MEIISIQNAENLEHFEEFIGNQVSGVAVNGYVDEVRKCDSSFLARNGATCSLFELEEMMFEAAETTGERCKLTEENTTAKILMETLQCDGFRVLV